MSIEVKTCIDNEAMIKVQNLTKRFGKLTALDGVSFEVNKGDIFGYLGPNGAGKTTTIRIILGLLQPTAGEVLIMNESIANTNVRRKIGFVLEADGLYENMTGYNNLNYYGQIYRIPKDKRQQRVEEMVELVRLRNRINDRVEVYSKGMRQRLALARAMLHDPEILILDEPTAGVDPTGQIDVRNIILELAQQGKTIFLSSHNLDEVQRICNSIALIDHGKIKLCGELDKIQKETGGTQVVIHTQDEEAVLEKVRRDVHELAFVEACSIEDRKIILQLNKESGISEAIKLLADKGVHIEEVKKKRLSLEEIYVNMVKDEESI